jgi:hypothetical protein
MLQEQLWLSGGPRSFFCHDISAPSCECVDHGLRVFLRYHPTSFASRSEECVDAREKVACWMEITLPKTPESKLLQNTRPFPADTLIKLDFVRNGCNICAGTNTSRAPLILSTQAHRANVQAKSCLQQIILRHKPHWTQHLEEMHYPTDADVASIT